MANVKEYWDQKEMRAALAKVHTDKMEKEYLGEIEAAVTGSSIYDQKVELEKFEPNLDMVILLDELDSVSSVIKNSDGKTAVLNFSSYKNPGGKFMNGSSAQEECLCHESYLYNVLMRFSESFYAWNNLNKNRALYKDRAIYSPNIRFESSLIVKYADVITCAAPNKSAAQQYGKVSGKDNRECLEQRIKFVLDIAQKEGVETLILGAYGCGVFGQDPKEVARLFCKYIKNYSFKKVVFSIPDWLGENHRAFKAELKAMRKRDSEQE